jgi:hypothetical protein
MLLDVVQHTVSVHEFEANISRWDHNGFALLSFFDQERKKTFTFIRGIRLFLRFEAPGLVFSEEKNGGLPPVTSEKPMPLV